MSDEPRKRSRFDQDEPEPARKSRFDRRSRSPSSKDTEARRSRSPIAKSVESPSTNKRDAAAAAAAAAAKINASINAKKGAQQVDVPPIRKTESPGAGVGAAKSPSQPGGPQEDGYTQDGDFIKDIEVNDLRNRYTLTKGSTQKMIKEKTGADVTTRGNYYPDKSMATPANPPLYLHVTSRTKEGLEMAIKEIDELMQKDLPNLIDERRFRRQREPEQVERDHLGRRKWPEERIPVDLEPIPGFNLRAQVVGQGGTYVKYIQSETGCRVQIKGRGSGFMEHDTQRESDEQMYLHVASPDATMVEKAKEMCLQLLDSVRENYESFKQRPPRSAGPDHRGGFDNQRSGSNGGYQGGYNQDRNGSGSYGGNPQQDMSGYGGSYGGTPYQQQPAYGAPAGGAQSPTAPAPAMDSTQIAAWTAYYAQNPDEDPYKPYGGYAYIMSYYAQTGAVPAGGQQAGGYAGSPQQQNGGYNAVPPPPGASEAPPPPPPPPGT
ncbi:uncharacterized protein LTR77_010427 [Saxophila tyrrhenica]|uniref:K Homology domain-containing protein n=1 Tax=Saxophila tyrrhenica TaxID=1690608 RepID=A0AAV9NZC8_9PEZI|nr:hypothetical protein LTR77_010427 [Saxophila tyrrhenica]